MDKWAIEQRARELQMEIWQHRMSLWPDGHPSIPEMFTPEMGAHVLGAEYAIHPEIKSLALRCEKFEIAGLVDRQRGLIVVSQRFNPQVMRFTGAHEIGHWEMHPAQPLHRDRPINGLSITPNSRPQYEAEADHFAACYLMPRNAVRKAFQARFGNAPLVINDSTAFALNPSDHNALLYAEADSLDCELAIASARSYNGRLFASLADEFRVSPTSMAIRLRELALVWK